MTYDDIIPEHLKIDQLVQFYLMASYLYYCCNDSFYTDAEYDILAKRLLNHWGEITHRHKGLIDFRSLKSKSSAYYIPEHEYPQIVTSAAIQLLNQLRKSDRSA